MELKIDGMSVIAKPGQSLLDLVCQLGLDYGCLSKRPIAARIAGEVFNLNYVPVRQRDDGFERPSIRTAMAASGGIVQLLRYSDPSGKDVYSRTVQFLLFLALQRLWPHGKAKMNCTVGAALFVGVENIAEFDAEMLKVELRRLIEMNIPLVRRRTTTAAAIDGYIQSGQMDKARLLKWRNEE